MAKRAELQGLGQVSNAIPCNHGCNTPGLRVSERSEQVGLWQIPGCMPVASLIRFFLLSQDLENSIASFFEPLRVSRSGYGSLAGFFLCFARLGAGHESTQTNTGGRVAQLVEQLAFNQ